MTQSSLECPTSQYCHTGDKVSTWILEEAFKPQQIYSVESPLNYKKKNAVNEEPFPGEKLEHALVGEENLWIKSHWIPPASLLIVRHSAIIWQNFLIYKIKGAWAITMSPPVSKIIASCLQQPDFFSHSSCCISLIILCFLHPPATKINLYAFFWHHSNIMLSRKMLISFIKCNTACAYTCSTLYFR